MAKHYCGLDVPAGPVVAYVTRPSARHVQYGLRLVCPMCWPVISKRGGDFVRAATTHVLPCGSWVYIDRSKPSTNGHGAFWLEPTTAPEA